MTNFNVNSSLDARVRSVFQENQVPKLPLVARNLAFGWPWLPHRTLGFFRPPGLAGIGPR